MNHAWVWGGVSVPNSAVPVLPAIGWPGIAAAVPVPVCTTPVMSVRSASVVVGGTRPGAGPLGRAGSRIRVGECQLPLATVEATPAMASGLATTRPCPIAAATCSVGSFGAGNDPPLAAMARSGFVPKPNAVAALPSASVGRSLAKPMNAVLHEIAKAREKGSAGSASPSKFLNSRPPTVIVGGQVAGESSVVP